MLDLYARTPWGLGYRIDSSDEYRLTGNRLEGGPERQEVATYDNGYWTTRGGTYPRLEIRAPVTACVEDATGAVTRRLGQFQQLAVVDGCVHGDGHILATCPGQCSAWDLRDGTTQKWPVIILAPTEAKDREH